MGWLNGKDGRHLTFFLDYPPFSSHFLGYVGRALPGLCTGVCDPPSFEAIFYHFPLHNELSKVLPHTRAKPLVVDAEKGMHKELDILLFFQQGVDLCGSFSPSKGITLEAFLLPFAHRH